LLPAGIKGPGNPGPLLFAAGCGGVNMRKPDVTPVTANRTSLTAGAPASTPVELVCLALAMALLALAARIASIW
jgi:hypothetical protein